MNRKRWLLSAIQIASGLFFFVSFLLLVSFTFSASDDPLPTPTPAPTHMATPAPITPAPTPTPQGEAALHDETDSSVLTLATLLISNLVSLATLVTTTIYRVWDERRTRTKYKLDVAKTELEILKLQKELEETQQKEKKRRP